MATKKSSSTPAIHFDDFIEKIVTNPAAPPEVIVFNGFIGRSNEKGHIRLYHDENLSRFIEIDENDILFSRQRTNEENPLGGSILWLRKNGKYIFGNPSSDSRKKLSFFEGTVIDQYNTIVKQPEITSNCPAPSQECMYSSEYQMGGAKYSMVFCPTVRYNDCHKTDFVCPSYNNYYCNPTQIIGSVCCVQPTTNLCHTSYCPDPSHTIECPELSLNIICEAGRVQIPVTVQACQFTHYHCKTQVDFCETPTRGCQTDFAICGPTNMHGCNGPIPSSARTLCYCTMPNSPTYVKGCTINNPTSNVTNCR